MDCRIPITPFITSFAIVISCFIYCIHSENHLYTANSIEDFLFTPGEMMQLEKLCQTMPKLSYHSATATKPVVIHLHCQIPRTEMNDFLFRHQFQPIDQGIYQKRTIQLRLSDARHDVIPSVELIQY
ncbi:hypothetical protein VA7868_03713 [Vibrio aerogenes CECT 7868]|uniref:Uncharacterized protein n=1 Tax=Vibrio aerogenes CECT 7868 TaxID=1216006 RepID=A0A1M6B5A2_9VIBR|nr:hypothetical protein [Vibrio aerogenes]SHI43875.1 hypothetical protein VA7868_03713 [Vibrio aerogenes CECT 7868]